MSSKFKVLYSHLTPKEGWFFITALLIFFISLFGLLILIYYNLTTPIPVSGGTWREGIVGSQPSRLNPITSGNNDADRDLISLIFCTANDVAAKIESSNNNKTWQLRLKENLTWHNGHRLTSDDIIFSISKMQDPKFKSPLSATWTDVKAERVSELEISFTLPSAFAFFQDKLNELYLVPKHLFADIPLDNWHLSEYRLQPIGCGPYKYDSYQNDSDGFITRYNLTANSNFANASPFISNLEFRFYTNYQDAVKDFNLGKIDGLGGVDKNIANLAKRVHDRHLLPTPRYYAVFINDTDSVLSDKNVRLALNTAIDRPNLIGNILGNGWGKPVTGPITPNFLPDPPDSSLNFNSPSTSLEAKIEAANNILDNSLWLRDDDISLRQKNSLPLEIDLTIPDSELMIKTGNYLASTWDKLGVKTNLIILPSDYINSEVIPDRAYEMILFGNIIGQNPDIFSFWHSSQIEYPGLNLALYKNSAADRLIESIRQDGLSPIDPDSKPGSLTSLSSLITQDIPAFFLYSPDYAYLTSHKLQGFSESELIITPDDRFDNISSWYLKTVREFK